MDAVFSKIDRDFGNNWEEGDVIEWTGEALEHMSCVKSYEEAVAFREVKNHQVEIPKFMHSIIQIGRNNKWTPSTAKTCETPLTISTEVQNLAYNSTCNDCQDKGYVILDQNGKPLVEYDVAYYRPYFDLIGEYHLWSNSARCKQNYTPVRLSEHSFFDSLVCTLDPISAALIGNNKDIYTEPRGDDEYKVVAGKMLRFSFLEGLVAIAYTRQVVDNTTGYPMIPDNISFKEGIFRYITMKMLEKDCYNGREASCGKAENAANKWDWYCGQATGVDKMIHGEDEHQNLLEQRSYILPRNNRYYGFFGNLGKKEFKKFNDPDNRNRRNNYVTNG
jgi:hypothetical protein